MKKLLCILTAAVLAFTLCACGSNSNEDEIDVSTLEALTVGVPAGKEPGSIIFGAMSSRIAKKGYRVEYVEYETAQDANEALAAGEIDISLITQKHEFDSFNETNPETLLNLGPAYYIPYGIFLCNFEEFEDIADKAVIAIPDTAEGQGRALLLLEANGFIKLKDGAGLDATLDDVTENSRDFEFVQASEDKLAESLDSFEYDITVMSAQACIDAGYSLDDKACAIEATDSEAAKKHSVVLLIKRDDISSEKYKTVEPLYFSALMYETIDLYSQDLITPSFSI